VARQLLRRPILRARMPEHQGPPPKSLASLPENSGTTTEYPGSLSVLVHVLDILGALLLPLQSKLEVLPLVPFEAFIVSTMSVLYYVK